MEAFNHSHKICRKCAKELNEQKDCSNIGCNKKRHLIHSTCKNHYQRPGEMVVCCEICGEARSLQVRSPKGKKMNVCTRFQNEACFLLCKAKNSSGERCPKPRYRSVEKYKTFCGSKSVRVDRTLNYVDLLNSLFSLMLLLGDYLIMSSNIVSWKTKTFARTKNLNSCQF